MRGCSMPAGKKRSCAICVVERTGQGSCRRQVRQNARIVRYGATQLWHCQKKLARITRTPLSFGTASVFWLSVFFRHSGLALPKIIGVERPRATQDCTARESWLPGSRTSSRPPRRILQTATPLAPTATRTLSRCQYSEPIRDTNPTERNIPMFTELCIAFYTVMTLGIASAFLFTHAQQAK